MSLREPLRQSERRFLLSLGCGVILAALSGLAYADTHGSGLKVRVKPTVTQAGKLHASKSGCKPNATKAVVKPPRAKAARVQPSHRTAGQLPTVGEPGDRLEEAHLASAVKGLDFGSGRVRATAHLPGGRSKAREAARLGERSLVVENIWFRAAEHFRDAILADPTYAPAHEGLARSLLMQGNPRLAAAALRTAISLDPDLSSARFELGGLAQMKGDYSGAVAIWKALVARNPDYPDAYARMAIASYFGNDPASAWKYLAEADRRKQNVPPQFRDLLKQVAPGP
jgi:hypothetical protein